MERITNGACGVANFSMSSQWALPCQGLIETKYESRREGLRMRRPGRITGYPHLCRYRGARRGKLAEWPTMRQSTATRNPLCGARYFHCVDCPISNPRFTLREGKGIALEYARPKGASRPPTIVRLPTRSEMTVSIDAAVIAGSVKIRDVKSPILLSDKQPTALTTAAV